ncbi:acetyl-CoA carboxylase biotin carboxyl carrier protein [Ochrobactrum sp. 19YEA23]|uniref:acetyl-CoA carboxylase biotin carboxyl carrier protein n=1 Tax=Ochrobactrum sp. 19YEA23 TaxID=3039854 RepID=UPI002478BB89|nr:acetyl-CoA carboxylase biotin carboxyl carrier protein [Ochrobactrum sp. 19YEA23]
MNLERVKDLLDLMSSSSVKELVLIDSYGEIRLRRDAKDAALATAKSPPAFSQAETQHTSVINAPLPGILYLAPSPDAAPYAIVGSAVKKGDTVALIEAMKTMVPVAATQDGIVAAIFAKNETSVDSAQKLFGITTAVE